MTNKTFKCPRVERKESFPYGARLDRYDYWRLVLPGEKLKWGDEYKFYPTRYPKEEWRKSGCGSANQFILDAGTFPYRRRVRRE